jgi:hypothetical protein
MGSRAGLEHGGEEKNSLPLPGLEPPIIQLVAQRYITEPRSAEVKDKCFTSAPPYVFMACAPALR